MKQMKHNIPITRWGNDGTKPCPRPNVNWRHLPRADGKWRMERGCAWCGWTEPARVLDTATGTCTICGERIPDDDAVIHYHPGAVIMLIEEEKKEAN